MKVKDIVNEGLVNDLRAIGQKAQRDQALAAKAGLGRLAGQIKGALTPKFYSDFADKVAGMRKGQDLAALADAWAANWEKEFKRLEQGQGQALSDDEYRGQFRRWLEQTAKVRVDPQPVEQMIQVQSTQAVRDYFLNHFIPAYQKTQTNPVFVIPDGETVEVISRVGSTNTSETYTWRSNRGHWYDSAGNEVPAFSNLHNTLTQDAMDKAHGTTGGGGAATI